MDFSQNRLANEEALKDHEILFENEIPEAADRDIDIHNDQCT